MAEKSKPSPTEQVKTESQFLRGTIRDELAGGEDKFSKSSAQILKHHGTYQQDDRDGRSASRAASGGKAYMFMVRTRIPGGRLTSGQLLAHLELGDELGNGTLRATSRQGFQLHGVLKHDLAETIRRINESRLTTLGACGDVNRNVMCCPAPYDAPIHREVEALSESLAHHFAPRTSAYHEIWLEDPETGERERVGADEPGDEVEPIYGATYLPRKFKMAIGFPHDNCVDLYTQDLALLAIVRDGAVIGYNVLVGGGQGVTPSNQQTFPALARRLGFVAPDQAVAVAEAVVRVQRDHGNRSDRKRARLKYLIHEWGLDRFKAQVEEVYGASIDAPLADDVHAFSDHLGWEAQGDGRWFYGLNIENGRIADTSSMQLKAALREICEEIAPGIRLTSHQSMLFTDVDEDRKDLLEAIFRRHHVPMSEHISAVRRWSMACVAWPTCGLAITESERALPGIIDELEVELARLGLAREVFTIRMTGCPNGCARPYNSDIGIVGKAKDRYTILLGGRLVGNRLNAVYKDLVPREEIVPTLVPLFAYFKSEAEVGESFGDFCHRKGHDDLAAFATEYSSEAA